VRGLIAVVLLATTACAQTPVPTASTTPEPTPISEETAVSIARAQPSPRTAPDDEVLVARRTTFGELGPIAGAPSMEPTRCVWVINLGYDPGPLMGHGSTFYIDCLTGEVLHSYGWVS
jgi:hypothetical protein